MFTLLKKICVGVSLALAATAVSATPIAGVEWNGNPQTVFNSGPWMMGYEFAATSAVSVSALGAFDNLGNGFVVAHTVGLWTLSGTLLASVSVNSADALLGHFRYRSIAPVVLTAGQRYVVGADNWGGGGDDWGWRETGGLGLIEAPGIDFIQDKFASGSAFTFPGSSEGTFRDGFFGGNLMVDSVSVPEPASLALLGIGLAGLAAARRRKQMA